jgi:hypothetical protein
MLEVDHINRNRLDNRRANLRVVERSANSMNVPGRGASSFVGVSWFRPAKLWRAYMQVDGRRVELGYFKEEREAAKARDRAFIAAYGAIVTVNLPEEAQ